MICKHAVHCEMTGTPKRHLKNISFFSTESLITNQLFICFRQKFFDNPNKAESDFRFAKKLQQYDKLCSQTQICFRSIENNNILYKFETYVV